MTIHHISGTDVGSSRQGFTLLEILIVIGVISVLVGLIVPAVLASREAAHKTQCLNNLRQIALAANNYASVHSVYPASGGLDELSVFVRLLPHLDQKPLYNKFDFSLPMSKQGEAALLRPSVLACPSSVMAASSKLAPSYAGNAGWDVLIDRTAKDRSGVITYISLQPVRPADVRDGLSQTVMFGEVRAFDGTDKTATYAENSLVNLLGSPPEILAAKCLEGTQPGFGAHFTCWTAGGAGQSCFQLILPPNSRNCTLVATGGSFHSADGAHVAMCDTAVRFENSAIDVRVWRALGTRHGKDIAQP